MFGPGLPRGRMCPDAAAVRQTASTWGICGRPDADGSSGGNPGSLVYAAGFSAGAGSSARSPGCQEEMPSTLKAGNNDTSGSARYKVLGNPVAIPCVEYLMQGIALALRAECRIKTSPGT